MEEGLRVVEVKEVKDEVMKGPPRTPRQQDTETGNRAESLPIKNHV